MLRNTAGYIDLFAIDVATNLGKTGDAANLTAYVTGASGTVTALADTSAAELDATNAPGWYRFAVTSGESDDLALLFTAKSSTSGVSVVGRPVFTTYATGDAFARLGAPAGASVSADLAAVKVDTAAILVDTNELQADWANGGRLDLILDARSSQTSVDDLPTNAELSSALAAADDANLAALALVDAKVDAVGSSVTAVQAKTDSLTFTNAGVVDANITHVISDPVQQNGSATTNWGGAP